MVSFSDSSDGWGSLPLDVAFLVLDNFSEFIDLVRFRMVCKEWGRLAKLYSQSTKLCRKFPMLVIPKRNRKEGGRKYKGVLHNLSQEEREGLSTNVRYCIHFPKTKIDGSRRYCSGCGHGGWLAIVDVVLEGSSEYAPEYESTITLFNPFTETELPSLPPLRENDYRLKVVLSDDPISNPNDYMVVVIYMDSNELNFIKAGQNWQRITFEPPRITSGLRLTQRFSDAIFYKGQVCLADQQWGAVAMFDFNGKQQTYSQTDEARMTFVVGPFRWDSSVPHPERAYLIESNNGDLLFVRRFVISDRTMKFKIHKLLFSGSIVEHVEVNNIGDEALFVGDNQSVSVLASSIRGCQPNCIYFTDGYTNFELYDDCQGGDYYKYTHKYQQKCDMGFFNLEDGPVEPYCSTYTFATPVPPPFWIIPQFIL